MSEDLVVRYVELALEARAKGKAVDLAAICSEHPELIPEVDKLLRLDDAIDFEPSDDPMLGQVLDDRYELQQCIGVGAMGSVYLARDRTLDRDVAVKLLQNGVLASKERHERFAREARVLASLRHPNIVNVFDHGSNSPGAHYIVMERLVGVPMAQLSQQAEEDTRAGHHPLDSEWLLRHFEIDVPGLSYLPQVVFWCSQVASALEEAHAAGITHRDVKPTNIFIDATGAAILLDFGIAAKEGDGTLTADGSTIGSPWYMAPEQVGNRAANPELVDVYGLCATLYHLVTMRPPYEGDYAEVIAQLANTDPTPPHRIRPELSRDLCAVLEKGMERDPSRRYASMKELAADLRALYAQLPVAARPVTRFVRWLRAVRRRPAPAAAAALLVLGVGITIPVVSWSRDQAFARESARRLENRELSKHLAPSMAMEGKVELRPNLDPEVRAGYLAQLDRLVELVPGDRRARLLRSALLLDAGDLPRSLADIEWIADHDDTPFLRAFVARYRQVDTDQPGVAGLDLAGLPEPETDVDRSVLGFQLLRLKKWTDAGQVLAPVTSLEARTIRLFANYKLASNLFRQRGDRSRIDAFLDEVNALDDDRGGVTARSLYYRGCAHNLLRDWENSIEVLERSRALCPDAYGTNFNLAQALISERQYDLALERLEHARTLRPANGNLAYQVVHLLIAQRHYDRARAALDDAPKQGYLVPAYYNDYWRGVLEANVSITKFAARDWEGAAAAEARALESYTAALRIMPPGSEDASRLRENIKLLQLSAADQEARAKLLLQTLSSDPTSLAHIEALKIVLEDAGLMATEELESHVLSFLEALREELHRQTISKPRMGNNK